MVTCTVYDHLDLLVSSLLSPHPDRHLALLESLQAARDGTLQQGSPGAQLLREDFVLLVVSRGVVQPNLAGVHPSKKSIRSIEHFLHVRRLGQS